MKLYHVFKKPIGNDEFIKDDELIDERDDFGTLTKIAFDFANKQNANTLEVWTFSQDFHDAAWTLVIDDFSDLQIRRED
jgi:hypothetical protein